jgi:hypothetical protein
MRKKTPLFLFAQEKRDNRQQENQDYPQQKK